MVLIFISKKCCDYHFMCQIEHFAKCWTSSGKFVLRSWKKVRQFFFRFLAGIVCFVMIMVSTTVHWLHVCVILRTPAYTYLATYSLYPARPAGYVYHYLCFYGVSILVFTMTMSKLSLKLAHFRKPHFVIFYHN